MNSQVLLTLSHLRRLAARLSRLLAATVLALATAPMMAADPPKPLLKTEHFNRDPGWDNSVNRAEASDPPTIRQDFGWRRDCLAGRSGAGRVTVTLDGEPPFTLDLKPEQRKAGATFDRFGLMSFRRGGKFSVLYFDDLTYTTRRGADDPAARREQKITTVPFPK